MMNDQFSESVEDGLDYYDPEGRVFPEIAIRIASGLELTEEDLLQILKWKLGRIKDSNAQTISAGNMAAVNKAIKDARNGAGRLAALEALERVPGIGLATATAILTVCYPGEFSIIDWRVLEILNLFPSRLPHEKRSEHRADDWAAKDYLDEFLPKIEEKRRIWGCSLRDADRALWGLSVRRRAMKIIRNEI